MSRRGQSLIVGKDFHVALSPPLSSFTGPNALTHVGVAVGGYLQANAALTTIGPFPSLGRIGGAVRIEGNPALATVHLFDRVTSVDGGTIRIADNPVLTTIPFTALASAADDITFSGNPLLSECVLEDLSARLTAGGWTHRLTADGALARSPGVCDGPTCVTSP